MATNKGTRLKQPHSSQDISGLEDELAEISQDLRSIRTKMGDKAMDALQLMTGTFRFYLAEMRQIAKDWGSELEKQLIERKAQQDREKKRVQLEDRKKKR